MKSEIYFLKDGRKVRENDEGKFVEVTCKLCFDIKWLPFKTKPHQFCSYSCASKFKQHSKGNTPSYDKRGCVICGAQRKKRIYDSAKPSSDPVCSKKCAGVVSAKSRGYNLDNRKTKFVDGKKYVFLECCQQCGNSAWTRHNGKQQQYCSHSCASKAHSEMGCGTSSNEKRYAYWLTKYGKLEADIRLKKLTHKKSIATIKRNNENKLSDLTRERIASSVRSAYADGRLKPPGFRYSRHKAHGYNFRSRLELCYANELVEAGLTPGIDWEYEPEDLKVFWVDHLGVEHTYHPDFRVLGDIIEVKPKSRLNDICVVAKAQAAQLIANELGVEYRFVTERNIPSYNR